MQHVYCMYMQYEEEWHTIHYSYTNKKFFTLLHKKFNERNVLSIILYMMWMKFMWNQEIHRQAYIRVTSFCINETSISNITLQYSAIVWVVLYYSFDQNYFLFYHLLIRISKKKIRNNVTNAYLYYDEWFFIQIDFKISFKL